MTLVMAEVSIPLLGIIALDQLVRDGKKETVLKYLKYSLYITGGLLLLFIALAGSLFAFSAPGDAGLGLPDWLISAIQTDRVRLLRTDAIRSLVFIALTFGLLWAYVGGKLKLSYLLIILQVLLLADMWPVNKRYLNDDDFLRRSQVDNPYQATKADQSILKDKDLSYRVYNFGEAFDQSARTSYFHKNIGGYHGAKMRRYQEVIDIPLSRERQQIAEAFSDKGGSPEEALRKATAFNMLNTRYYIVNASAEPLQNPYACGNAWFVRDFRLVNNADEEMAALDGLDPVNTAVIDKRFESAVRGFTPAPDPGGTIGLVSYAPNHLVYEYSSPNDAMAVFSEIFYDKGWNAYVDGRKSPHFRADFILRAMILPAGDHKLEFKFEPKSFYAGQNVSLAASLLLLLALGGVAVRYFLDRKNAK
jgi:hypothetical protein